MIRSGPGRNRRWILKLISHGGTSLAEPPSSTRPQAASNLVKLAPNNHDSGMSAIGKTTAAGGRAGDTRRIRVRTGEDVLGVVPYLLGFVPQESLIALVIHQDKMEVMLRMERADIRDGYHDLVPALARWIGDDQRTFILICYANQHQDGEKSLDIALECLSHQQILMALVATSDRYWTRGFEEGGQITAAGQPYHRESSQAAAQAVYLGLQALGSRKELSGLLAAPTGADLVRAQHRCDAAELWLAGADADTTRKRLSELLAADSLGSDDAILLGVMAGVAQLRADIVLALDNRVGIRMVDRWVAVCRHMPRGRRLHPLVLTGLTSWVTGHGSMASICLDQALPLAQGAGLIDLLKQVRELAIPPDEWEEIRELAVQLARLESPGDNG